MDHACKLKYAEFFAQLQSVQDLLADRLDVCLVLIDPNGHEVTLPSRLPLICNHHDSRKCHTRLVAQVGSECECPLQQCPDGLYVAVIETSIRTDDGSLYLLAGRTTDRLHIEEQLGLLQATYTLPFATPFATERGRKPAATSPHGALTPQENKVLACLVAGLTNKDIAQRLCISQSTVKAHVANLLKKLNLSNRTEASVYALKNGIHLDNERV